MVNINAEKLGKLIEEMAETDILLPGRRYELITRELANERYYKYFNVCLLLTQKCVLACTINIVSCNIDYFDLKSS